MRQNSFKIVAVKTAIFRVAFSSASWLAIGLAVISVSRMALAELRPSTPAQYLNYGEAVQVALHDNADLLALREQESSFKIRSQQALAPNNPVFSIVKTDVPGFSVSQMAAEDQYQVTYVLGFPGKAFQASALIRFQAEATRELAYAKEIDLMTSLSNNFVAFANNQKIYDFLLDEQRRDKDLKRLLEKKFAASQAAKVDLLNAEVVSQGLAQSVLENRNEFETLVTQFRQLIRRPDDRNLYPAVARDIVVPEVTQSLDALTDLMLSRRPALRGGARQVAGSEASLTLAKLSLLPDFQFSAGINVWNQPNAAPNPGVLRDYALGVGIAIPLFFPFNEFQGINAARHDLAAARSTFESLRIQALADLQTAYTGYVASRKELDSLSKLVIPAAKASYDLTLLTYGLGRADYFRLNEARKSWLDSEKSYLAKRQTHAQLYNQMIAQVGCDFATSEGPYACK